MRKLAIVDANPSVIKTATSIVDDSVLFPGLPWPVSGALTGELVLCVVLTSFRIAGPDGSVIEPFA